MRDVVLNVAALVGLSVGPGCGLGATLLFEGTQFHAAASVLLVFILLGTWPQIDKLVQEARTSKAPSRTLADRAAQWRVLAAIVIGIGTFAVRFWMIGDPLLFTMTLTITVFVIACPDALGLATPMAVMVGTGIGRRTASCRRTPPPWRRRPS